MAEKIDQKIFCISNHITYPDSEVLPVMFHNQYLALKRTSLLAA